MTKREKETIMYHMVNFIVAALIWVVGLIGMHYYGMI